MGTRVVFDTNVLISALGWGGKPEQCLTLVFEDEIEAHISPPMLDELERVLDYDRFEFSREEKQSFLQIVAAEFHIIQPDVDFEVVRDDPDDDIFLECAVSADADYLVSGDTHLRDLGQFRGVTLLTPDEFLDEVD